MGLRGPKPTPILLIQLAIGEVAEGKACSICGVVKALDEFHINKASGSTGDRNSQCRPCYAEKRQAYYAWYNRNKRKKVDET